MVSSSKSSDHNKTKIKGNNVHGAKVLPQIKPKKKKL